MKVRPDNSKPSICAKYLDDGSLAFVYTGDLDYSNSTGWELPFRLTKTGGHLDLENSNIGLLPDCLDSIGGYLDLRGTNVSYMNDGLRVNGDVYLQRSKVTILPENMQIDGTLDIVRYCSTPATKSLAFNCHKEPASVSDHL